MPVRKREEKKDKSLMAFESTKGATGRIPRGEKDNYHRNRLTNTRGEKETVDKKIRDLPKKRNTKNGKMRKVRG